MIIIATIVLHVEYSHALYLFWLNKQWRLRVELVDHDGPDRCIVGKAIGGNIVCYVEIFLSSVCVSTVQKLSVQRQAYIVSLEVCVKDWYGVCM